MSQQLITALRGCINVMDRELNGLAVIQPELRQARKALAAAEANPEPWDGEGPPPVGTTCEWHPSSDQLIVVTILGRDGDETWFRRKGAEDSETCLRMAFFSPIRTPEQIASEEQEKAIQQVEDAISHIVSRDNRRDAAEAIYKAGYRKQVAPAVEKDTREIDFSIKRGDIVQTESWPHSNLEVVDVNWALRAVAVRLGPTGGIVVWPAGGMKKVAP